MSQPWWVWKGPGSNVWDGQAASKAAFASVNDVPESGIHGPYTRARADALVKQWGGAPATGSTGGGQSLPGWWVIEQFYPDGSAKFGVSQFTTTPAPPDNQVVYGTWPTKAAAEAAISDGSFRNAPHVYRGGNVSGSGGHGGPGGINIPGNQAPGNPVPAVSSLLGISNFFHALTEKSTWIRIVEVVLGGALLIIALAKLASGTPAGKAAMKIGTKAALL
jgi:hypothetical protein